MAKLPSVVSNLAPDLRAFVNRVREALDSGGNNRLITVNDLISSGIAVPGPGGTIIPPSGGGVITTPPTPKNVAANGAIQNIVVTWDDPLYFGHAYAEVWGSDTDNLGDAVQIGMAPGAIFIDAIGPSSIRYYWVRFVNTLGTAGAFNAVAGVQGVTGPAVEYLIDTLTDAALDPDSPYTKFAVRADLFYVVPEVDFNQESTPTATATGDLWYQPSTEITRTWDGSAWSSFSVQLPFIVNSSPQTINGVAVPAGVYMDAAFIKNGTITNAKIGNAAIDDAKIANLSAGKITAGSISVGSFIQSSNYLIGSQGWKIHGDGTAEFAAAAIRGQLTAAQIDSRGLSIRDANNNIILNAGSSEFLGNVAGTVAGTAASTVVNTANTALSTASTAQGTANSAVAGLTTKLNSNAQNVLAGAGGLSVGTLTWNSSGTRTGGYGIGFSAGGFAAYNTSGVATFALDASNGNAFFAGTLSAATGTFSGSLTAQAVNAVSTINIAGESVVTMDQFVTVKYTNGGNNTGTTIYTGSFNMASAGNVFFSCVSKFESNSPAADVSSIALSVGSSVYFATGRDLLSQSVKVISAKGYFAAGPQTFEVQHTYQNIEADDVLYVTTITLMKGYR